MDKSLTYVEDLTPHLIQGKVLITPHSLNHNRAARNIFRLFDNYLDGKDSEVFSWGVTLFLTAMHRLLPDMMVVCNPGKVREDGVHGAPDLIAEVLSPATIRIDRIQKTQLYGQCGVREYWIVDAGSKSVEVYLNENGRLHLQNVYVLYSDDAAAKMSEEQRRREVVEFFQSELFPNLTVSLRDIFKRIP